MARQFHSPGPIQRKHLVAMGIIRYGMSGWRMSLVRDQQLVDAIGQEVLAWYE